MDATSLSERTRLVREAARVTDAERRRLGLSLIHVVAMILFGLAPLAPRAGHLFGALSGWKMLAIVSPSVLSIIGCLVTYRRFGSESRAYRTAEIFEVICCYSVNVATAIGTGIAWSVLWILCPFSWSFLAMTKPFDVRLHTIVLVTTHAAGAVFSLVRGEPAAAVAAITVGAGAYAVCSVIGRHCRGRLTLEAERNVARARLDEAILEEERNNVATLLKERIGRELAELTRELAPQAAEHAAAAASELERILDASKATACSVAELMERIDERCRALCDGRDYAGALSTSSDSIELSVDALRATAIVRVAQELVRNAVVHGGAHTIRIGLGIDDGDDAITMSVEDDGSGLSEEHFRHATGGLDNAARWLGELGGSIDRVPPPDARGTILRAALPRTA